MSLLLDETAGDLPVRDVGLMRGGLMPAVPGVCLHLNTGGSKRDIQHLVVGGVCAHEFLL